jgi:two-component system nitrogen regulation response regulator GlnG
MKKALLLDEIGDMQLPTQTKILRAIQEGEIQRVGATKVKKVDVRLLAATHKDLEAMVKEKSFREDLYYRLNVVRIKTPALRERMEDLPELVDFMLQRLNKEKGTAPAEISREAIDLLCKYVWPGNVRELENVLHSASIISKGKRILSKDLPATLISEIEKIQNKNLQAEADEPNKESSPNEQPPFVHSSKDNDNRVNFGESNLVNDQKKAVSSAPSSISCDESFDMAYAHARNKTDRNLIETVEKEIIHRALVECGGNQVKASALLGITRATLRKRIDVFEIRY